MEEGKKGKGEGKRGGKGTERRGKRENGEGKEGKIVEKNLKLKGERYENEQRTSFFFFFFLLVTFCFLKPLKFV